MDELEKIREEIDEIDRKMVALFEARMERVQRVAEYKRKNKLPILHPAREEEVRRKNRAYLQDKTLEKPLENFFIELMKISREIQEED